MSETKEKKKPYLDVNVPRAWEAHFEELLERPEIKMQVKEEGFSLTYSGLGVWIIHRFLLDHVPSYRYQRVNTTGNRIAFYDRKLRRLIDIYVKPDKTLYCQFCNSTECEHIELALTFPDVKETLEKVG